MFDRRLASLTSGRSWDLLHPNDALRRMKQAMHSAARHTIQATMCRRMTTVPAKVQALFQMARAIARADTGLAKKAAHSLPPLAVCVRMDATGVAVTQPERWRSLQVHLPCQAWQNEPLSVPEAQLRPKASHEVCRLTSVDGRRFGQRQAAVSCWVRFWPSMTETQTASMARFRDSLMSASTAIGGHTSPSRRLMFDSHKLSHDDSHCRKPTP